MAHILDTASIQPDTITLSGYDEIWSVADIHRNPSSDLPGKLDAMAKAAENYKWAAEDLPNLSVRSDSNFALEAADILPSRHEICCPYRF
jgi:hypothetical protein